MRIRPTLSALLLLPLLAVRSSAQAQPRPLSDYVGVYDYAGRDSVVVVPDRPGGTRLLAVIGGGKYPLTPAGADRFTNRSGDTIPFERNARGRVTGFRERGRPYARRHARVPAFVGALLVPRADAGGRPVVRYAYAPPAARGDGIPVASLAAMGIDAGTMHAMVERVLDGSYPDVHAVLLLVRDTLVLEEYFYGTGPDIPHELRSATKTLFSLLAGIAIDRGLLPGDTARAWPLLGFVADDPRKDAIRVADLLTARSGLDCDDWNPSSPGHETVMYDQPSWMAWFAALPVAGPPGATARYCSAGAIAVGRIVERAAGVPLPRFAEQALFAPLGIAASQVQWRFQLDSGAREDYAQAWLRPRDMAKIGVLARNGGRWNGRQVVPEAWLRRSTGRHATLGARGYGYSWWQQYFNVPGPDAATRVDTYLASGNGGQKIFVIPSLEAVVVFTGGAYNVESATAEIMVRDVLPALLARRR